MPSRLDFPRRSPVWLLIASAALQLCAACGSSNSAPPQQSASQVSSEAISCTPSNVAPGSKSQCSATVHGTGTLNSAVTWAVSAGTINSSGAFTAPSSPEKVTVTATSIQDSTITGTASLTVAYMVPSSRHVVLVMEENQGYSTIVGDTANWPNLNALIARGALATNYYADSHPSIGNYFMLTTGQILTTDDSSTQVWNVDNVVRRMLAANVSFRVYAEGITQGYLGGNTGLYVIRHNPFAMLSDVADSQQVANSVICPFSQFAVDLADNSLPQFSYIVPNVDDDAHSGTPLTADSWLQANVVTRLSASSAFQSGGDGILIVDFDEAATTDTSHGGGHVVALFWGPNVKAGYQQSSSIVYQHESMLATVMAALSLSNPPGLADNAPTMGEFFVQK
ncbi:MAG TPA: alkaline phosphatase family protein [Terracidiphilus sp.]|nr:alkaline phosphatase family protein [Terracidiphilus sp.]